MVFQNRIHFRGAIFALILSAGSIFAAAAHSEETSSDISPEFREEKISAVRGTAEATPSCWFVFQFGIYNSCQSSTESEATEKAMAEASKKATDQCERKLGGKLDTELDLEDSDNFKTSCNWMPGTNQVRCGATLTKAVCKIPLRDPRVATRTAAPEKGSGRVVDVGGFQYLIDSRGVAYPISNGESVGADTRAAE